MTNKNLYCFTGGPGSGKTTLLHLLHNRGFDIVQETAREIIKNRLRDGLSARPEPIDFALQIFNTDVRNYITHANASSPVFFDRSHIDSGCMIFEADPVLYHSHESYLNEYRYNPTIFLFPPWQGIYKNDAERDQSYSDSIKIHDTLSNWYRSHGYRILEVPESSPDERADFVVSHIQLYKNSV